MTHNAPVYCVITLYILVIFIFKYIVLSSIFGFRYFPFAYDDNTNTN